MRLLSWILIGAAAIAAGCAQQRSTVPATVSAPSARLARADVAVGKPDGPLTLDECIGIALARNPDVAADAWQAEAAEARRTGAAGQRWPSLHVTGEYGRYLDDQRLLPASGPGEAGVYSDDIFSSDLVVKLPLYTGGRISSEIRAAELLRIAADRRLARTRSELVFNVSSVFYAILGQQRVIESLQFSRNVLQEHRKHVDAMIAAQKAAKVDLLRTEVRLADIEQGLAKERSVLAIQRRVLTNLLGLDATAQPVAVNGSLEVPAEAVEPAADDAEACEMRPDLRAAESELQAQAERLRAARAARLPAVSLQAAYGGRWAPDGSAGDVGKVGIGLDIPIFEGGRLAANIREEQARLGEAQERLRKLGLQVRLDVEAASLTIASSLERIQATNKAVEQAGESLRIEREKYELGKGSITDVLDAQAALLEAQTSQARALADYHTSVAQLKLATGEVQ